MSVFPFIRNLIGVKEDNAFQIALDAIVKWDPEGSSAAQLLTMEQNLDLIGRRVESARDAYDREKAAAKDSGAKTRVGATPA